MTRTLILCLALPVALAAQDRGERQEGRGGFPPMRSPIVASLDVNQDGTISGAEIDNAPAALLTLDRNHDGHLMGEELRPMMPPGRAREGGEMRMGEGREGRGGNPDEPAKRRRPAPTSWQRC